MKTIFKLSALVLALSMLLSFTVSASNFITYSESGSSISVMEDDCTFTLVVEREPANLIVRGSYKNYHGLELTFTNMNEGETDIMESVTDEQKVELLVFAVKMFKKALGIEDNKAQVKPGIYTDETSIMVIAGDMTFKMITPGKTMEGEEYELTVTGEIAADGTIILTGAFNGDLDLTATATEEQVAETRKIAETLYSIAVEESEKSDNEIDLKIKDDRSYSAPMIIDLEGTEIAAAITGRIAENDEVLIESIVSGKIELIQIVDPSLIEKLQALIKEAAEANEQ